MILVGWREHTIGDHGLLGGDCRGSLLVTEPAGRLVLQPFGARARSVFLLEFQVEALAVILPQSGVREERAPRGSEEVEELLPSPRLFLWVEVRLGNIHCVRHLLGCKLGNERRRVILYGLLGTSALPSGIEEAGSMQ